ncbi:MAG: hypothetical protein ACLP62_06985 [Acidimicrobiales bacterium]
MVAAEQTSQRFQGWLPWKDDPQLPLAVTHLGVQQVALDWSNKNPFVEHVWGTSWQVWTGNQDVFTAPSRAPAEAFAKGVAI